MKHYLQRFSVFLGFIIVGLAFSPSLYGPFFFDDEHFILKNEHVLHFSWSWQSFAKIYRSSVTEGARIEGNFYRPHQQIVFAVVAQVVGLKAHFFHLVSIIFHLVNVVLVYVWMRKFFCVSSLAAILGAAFFGLHPVQTEAVCYISGLADPLSTCFMLIGLIVLGEFSRESMGLAEKTVRSIVGGLCFLVALLAKESAIVFISMLFITCCFAQKDADLYLKPLGYLKMFAPRKSLLGMLAGVVVVGSCYVGLRLSILRFNVHSLGLTMDQNIYTTNLLLRLVTFVNVLWDYFVLILWPQKLFYEKPYLAYDSLISFRGGFGIIVILLGIYGFLRPKGAVRFFAGYLIFLSALTPYMGWVPLNAMFLEHWLYMPLIGWALMIGVFFDLMGVETIVKDGGNKSYFKKGVAWTALLVLSLLASRTSIRAKDWASEEKFYLNEINASGGSLRVFNNLGMFYAERRQLQKALDQYQKAIELPNSRPMPQPYHNRARLFFEHGQWQEGMKELRAALTVDPKFVYSWQLLGQVFEAMGAFDRKKAVDEAIQAILAGEDRDYLGLQNQLFK